MRKYNVVILGARGTGKTVYLSALYHKLSTPGEKDYFLNASLHQQKQLNTAYASLLSKWLKPTALSQTDIFEFGVTAKSQTGSNHLAVTVCYYDMAGGRQTDASDDAKLEQETEQILKDADILLGLIDGERLQKILKGDHSDREFWMIDMQSLCAQMTKHDGKDKSLHFVLTKWDRFENVDASLKQVRELMLSQESFSNLISSCYGTARLIPVSSVGREYADILNGASGKNGDELPKPLNVEVPLACILPDIINRELKVAEAESLKRAKELQKEVLANLKWWEVLGHWFGNGVADFLEKRGLHGGMVRWAAEFARRSANQKLMNAAEITEQNRAEAQRLRLAVNDETSAVQFVLQSMANTESEFAAIYPSSKLK